MCEKERGHVANLLSMPCKDINGYGTNTPIDRRLISTFMVSSLATVDPAIGKLSRSTKEL
jgi:hypothetical protein